MNTYFFDVWFRWLVNVSVLVDRGSRDGTNDWKMEVWIRFWDFMLFMESFEVYNEIRNMVQSQVVGWLLWRWLGGLEHTFIRLILLFVFHRTSKKCGTLSSLHRKTTRISTAFRRSSSTKQGVDMFQHPPDTCTPTCVNVFTYPCVNVLPLSFYWNRVSLGVSGFDWFTWLKITTWIVISLNVFNICFKKQTVYNKLTG